MFICGDEWCWGVDRLYHLEQRFAGLGADLQAMYEVGMWGPPSFRLLERHGTTNFRHCPR
jgi:2-hydroxychromene-2-carboxylate isomerase